MAELGHDVLGVENDVAKLAALRDGNVTFYEPGLPEMIAKQVGTGRLEFTREMQDAAAFADVHFLCVGTPQLPTASGRT